MLYYFFEEIEQGEKNIVVLSFNLPLDENKYVYMAISNILAKGCRRYKTREDLRGRCKELEGTNIFNECKIEGDRVLLNFYLLFKYGKNEDEKREVLNLFLLYINENLVVNGGFKESYFKEAKDEIFTLIEERKNNPLYWGKEKMIGILQHGLLYTEIEENRLDKMNNISNTEMLRLWFDLKNNTSPIIQVCGESDLERLTKEILGKFMRISRIIPNKLIKRDETYLEIEEEYNGNKSVLILCIKSEFNIINNLEKLLITYNLLFGRNNSRLNKILKENGINGEVYSNLDYINGVISLEYIGDIKDIDIVLNKLKKEIALTETYIFDEKDILGAINKSLSIIEKISLDQYNYSMFLVITKSRDINYKLNGLKNRIKNLTLKDIQDGIEKMQLLLSMKFLSREKLKKI